MLLVDGKMLLYIIVCFIFKEGREKGLMLIYELVYFIKFILVEIFFGGWLLFILMVYEYVEKVGFWVIVVQLLQLYYVRMLDMWVIVFEVNKDQVIVIQLQIVYDCYMKYLIGCVKLFCQGYIDVDQFILEK